MCAGTTRIGESCPLRTRRTWAAAGRGGGRSAARFGARFAGAPKPLLEAALARITVGGRRATTRAPPPCTATVHGCSERRAASARRREASRIFGGCCYGRIYSIAELNEKQNIFSRGAGQRIVAKQIERAHACDLVAVSIAFRSIPKGLQGHRRARVRRALSHTRHDRLHLSGAARRIPRAAGARGVATASANDAQTRPAPARAGVGLGLGMA